jgi:hypothetical protein
MKGLIDEVRVYSRGLRQEEVAALYYYNGGDNTNLDTLDLCKFTDFSKIIPWGGNPSAGVSAFAVGDTYGKQAAFLIPDGQGNAGYEAATSLKTFTALDYRLPYDIDHGGNILNIEFDARWDTSSLKPDSAYFSVVVMDQYPDAGVSGDDVSNFIGDPFGRPALHVRIRPGRSGTVPSYLQYGGGNGGQFDIYKAGEINQWWLPGFILNADGSDSPVPGAGSEYPNGSWKGTAANLGTAGWATFNYRIWPGRQEIYRNDTLMGMMELPEYSATAPDYKYYDAFKAIRLYWRGLAPCYVANVRVTVEKYDGTENLAPSIAIASPSKDTAVTAGDALLLRAEGSDDAAIAKVEFYAGNAKIGESSAEPYECLWSAVPAGTHHLTIVATDNAGAVSVSPAVTVVGSY